MNCYEICFKNGRLIKLEGELMFLGDPILYKPSTDEHKRIIINPDEVVYIKDLGQVKAHKENVGQITIGVNVDTTQIDEALRKVEQLNELTQSPPINK